MQAEHDPAARFKQRLAAVSAPEVCALRARVEAELELDVAGAEEILRFFLAAANTGGEAHDRVASAVDRLRSVLRRLQVSLSLSPPRPPY
jgi:hypothetical protein